MLKFLLSTREFMSLPFLPRSLVTTTFGCFEHEMETEESETHAPTLNERRKQLRRCCEVEEDDVNGGGEKEERESFDIL